ncbi:MAG TPA: adenylate/guanylate cyclase domain-containing protein [Solirubrobacteraceae bacterium]|nr:adenylate/guanylate cyclase domain-containing protein [Solirubrobacteraceae bacterium]
MTAPPVRYAEHDGITLAWTEIGEGPLDILLLLGGFSHVEHLWDEPGLARYFERIATFSRVILMDRRGVGLSDPVSDVLTMEDECEDICAVLDAAGADRAVLYAYGWGGPVAIRFAARHPERSQALVLYAALASTTVAAHDAELERGEAEREREIELSLAGWGGAANIGDFAPSRAGDERLMAWFGKLTRLSSSPGAMRVLWRSTSTYDARGDLGGLTLPTLVLHRGGDRAMDVRHSRVMAREIPGSRYVELDGIDNMPSVGNSDALVAEIEEFLTGSRTTAIERDLLTILVTDIVGSTSRAAEMGDADWRDLLAGHHAAVRRAVDRFEGREVKDLGDGFLIAFSGAPSQAHRCALAIVEAVMPLGLEVRIGLHTGECELIGDDVGGMAVHIAARVAAGAGANEIHASGTAFGTVVGSGLRFTALGSRELRGVPGSWPILRLIG